MPPPPAATVAYTPTGPFGVSTTLTMWIRVLMWVLAGLSAVTVVLAITARSSFIDFWDAPVGSGDESDALERWIDLDDAFNGVSGVASLVWIAVFVLMIVWMFKAHKVTDVLRTAPRRWTRGWTIGGWFIPVANGIIPKLVLDDIERIAKSPRPGDRPEDVSPEPARTSAVGWAWWLLVVVGTILYVVSEGLMNDEDMLDASDNLRTGYAMSAVAFSLFAVGNVLGALHMKALGKRLSPASLHVTH